MWTRLTLACWLAWMLVGPAGAADAAMLTLDSAQAVASDAARYPSGLPAVPVELPDDWSQRLPGHAGIVWYRFVFNPPAGALASDTLYALYIERACSNVEVVF
ncbi:MAG: sensor histidine kinase, partial [Burkholderiaceae bacterium]